MTADTEHYDEELVNFLELLWGDGYLSPGGPAEIDRLLSGIDLGGKTVLDIGCGTGGITASLARDYGSAQIIGIDVEAPVCERARRTVREAGVADQVEIHQIAPGFPTPFADSSIDIVFSKDSIVHIPDKEALAGEAFRLLKPGGWFVASDWLIGHDDDPTPGMAEYIALEDLDFGMASPSRYQAALYEAGFGEVSLDNRNRWYYGTAQDELARMQGPERAVFEAKIGKSFLDEMIFLWNKMIAVLETGEHCPHHFRGRRPV
jgi:phosphoethanolamine N-methyltransferase